jgi:hypothetical protein
MKTHALGIALIALAAASVRADSFEGNWETQTAPQAGCSANSFQLKAANGKITGTMQNDGSTLNLSGNVRAEGSFTLDVAENSIAVSGTFNGDTFNFHWKGPCGDRGAHYP